MAAERTEAEQLGVSSRKRLRAATTLRAASTEPTAEAISLQAALREIRELQEERAQFQQREAALLARLERREEEQSRHITGQSDFILQNGNRSNANNLVGYKLKPDLYDGSVTWREFSAQFELIARANGWGDSAKTVALATCLRGKARSVLDGVIEIEELRFEELKSRLALRFGDGHLAQTYYAQFTNKRQKFGEDLATLGAEIERLSQLAYPECTHVVRDKIACAQFIAALSDGFIKRTLQLEGVSSLRSAVERAMAVKVIQENSFANRQFGKNNFSNGKGKNNFASYNKVGNARDVKDEEKEGERKNGNGKKFEKSKHSNNFQKKKYNQKKECWQCGAEGHFRSECPTMASEGNKE